MIFKFHGRKEQCEQEGVKINFKASFTEEKLNAHIIV